MPAISTAATSQPGMAGLIEDSIRRTPGQEAIGMADGSMHLSYRQLGQLARVLARQLAPPHQQGDGDRRALASALTRPGSPR